MAYATTADLLEALEATVLVQLTDDTGSGVVNQATIDRAVAQAEADINARVANRYQVPMAPVPALARDLTVTLALGRLYARRGLERPPSINDEHKAALALLNRIGEGKAGWGEAVIPVSQVAQVEVRMQSAPRVFDRAGMRGF